MKGIVFSEFIDMVDEKFSMEMSERLIDEVKPPSGGAYTTVGTYDAQEMVDLVLKLSGNYQHSSTRSIEDVRSTFAFTVRSGLPAVFRRGDIDV